MLSQLNADIDALEANVTPTWEGLVEPIERIFDRLERAWGAVSHLKVSDRSLLLSGLLGLAKMAHCLGLMRFVPLPAWPIV